MKNLKRLRQSKGLTQLELSEHSFVNKRMIEQYEIGERDINGARGITLWKLSKVLDCKIEDLLEGIYEKN